MSTFAGIEPLPADLSTLGVQGCRDALNQRFRVIEEKKAANGGKTPSMAEQDLKDLSRLNDWLEDSQVVGIKDRETGELRPFHPPGAGSSRTGGGKEFGRVEGLGAEFLRQAAKQNGGNLKSSLDATSGGATMPGSFFDPRIRDMPTRQLFVRSLIPTTRVTGSSVDFVRQTTQTLNAAAVSVGSAKPTSVLSAERVNLPVRVVAHVSEALDRSILTDFDALTSFIDQQLRIGVLLAEENQILNGDGTAPNISGILDQSVQTQAKGSDSTPDAVLKAITKVRNYFFEPDAVVFHPNDWQQVATLTTTDGVYIWGSPSNEARPSIWGKKVITSPVIAEGTALVGAFGTADLYERESVRVTFAETGLGDSSEEMFTHNLVRFRAESRIAVGVPFANAFCKVTGV